MPRLFAAIGCYGIVFGLWSLPTGLFIGPQFLVASLGHVLIGTLCVIISRGLMRRKTWAWWGGTILSFAILLLWVVAFVQSIHEHDVGGIAFYSIMATFMLLVFVTSLLARATHLNPT
jgi:hypothetical protein